MAPLLLNRPPDEAVVEQALTKDIPPLFDYLEGQLGSAGNIVGERFSIADIAIGTQFVNFSHAGCEVDRGRWPKLAAYVGGILRRPVFQKLLAEEQSWRGGS